MRKFKKTYSKPRRAFDKTRIEEEAAIKKEYGLKNKKEIWKAEAKIKSIREKAKKLISADEKEQEALFEGLRKIGLEVNTIADVLALETKNYLERRLQTLVMKKNISTTIKGARQLINHKKILVNKKIVNIPSYIVPKELEEKIELKPEKKKAKKEKPSEEHVEEKKEETAEEKKDE